MKTITLLKALHVYTSDDRSDSPEKENADNKKCAETRFLRRVRANEATLLSNAKLSVLYLGLNYSTTNRLPPLRREQILDSTLPFDRGIVELQYIPPERLFWDQAPAVPLMTSSISWGLLEHNYGDLQFIHICCCNEFFCTSFSCSNLCDLLPWCGSTANSQEWLMKDRIKIVFGAAEHLSNHTQNHRC